MLYWRLGINRKSYSNTNNPYTNRGGNYNNNFANNPAGNRNNNSDNANDNNGFRLTLIQFLDYMFYGIYTMKVLVLKRFIPS